MQIIGIHDGHNSSACYFNNGSLIAAIQEERFTYKKNQGGVPINSLNYLKKTYKLDQPIIVFSSLNINPKIWSREQIVAKYKTSNKFSQWIKNVILSIPTIKKYYTKRINIDREDLVKQVFKYSPIHYVDHHLSHASSAYFNYGIMDQNVLVFTADGAGDGLCATINIGKNGILERKISADDKHSLGRLYSYSTFLYNMQPLEHEYKIMGLAPYSSDSNEIEKCKKEFYNIIDFPSSTALRWKYVGNRKSIQEAGSEISNIFNNYRFDIYASALQMFVEEVLTEWVSRSVSYFNIDKVAVAGGLFMNIKCNSKLAEIPRINKLFVLPSCGDETNCIGAAQLFYKNHTLNNPKSFKHFYLGSRIEVNNEKLNNLLERNLKFEYYEQIEHKIAELLSMNEIVGRVSGRMEFGARSLGNRAILANPSAPDIVETLNKKIKNRDFWMPFAPSVLEEDFKLYFESFENIVNYEYMMFTCKIRKEKRKYALGAMHISDFTSRPQRVTIYDNPNYYKILKKYKSLTGESLILNTSYNLHGFPIVSNFNQAIDVFTKSGLEYLVIENYLITKR